MKKNITKEDLIKISDYCFEKTTYKVDFEIKKMKQFNEYDIEEKVYDFSNNDFENIDYYNQLYCSQLKGKTQKETYELRKTYIELFLCKLLLLIFVLFFKMEMIKHQIYIHLKVFEVF